MSSPTDHVKDHYFVLPPSPGGPAVSPVIVGHRLRYVVCDDRWRVYWLGAGPDYGSLVWAGVP